MAPPVAQRSDPPRPAPRARPSVLLVDDRPANLLALEALLDPLDAHTVRALDGREALQRAAEQDFAVVLLDVQLPDLSGLEVTARLREHGLNRRTPVLLMTAGDVGEAELLAGYAHGAVDFLRKPLVPAVLQAKVSVFLELFVARETAREQEKRLREREGEERFRVMAEAMPQLVWTTLPDGYHDYFNQRWYDYTGLPRGATDGEGWQNPFHPEDLVEADRRWRHSLATGEPYEVQYRCRRHDGAWRWMLGRALPIRSAQGAIVKWFGTCTDIDDQVRAVRELEAAQAENARLLSAVQAERGNLHALLMQMPVAATVLRGPRLLHELSNAAAQRIVGRPLPLGLPVRELLPELEGQGLFELLEGVYRTGDTVEAREVRARWPRGEGGALEERAIDLSYQPLRDAEGRIDGVVSFTVDVTAQLQARERAEALAAELKVSEQRFRTLAEAMPQLAWAADAQGTHDYFNQRFLDYTGAERGRTDADTWTRSMHPEDVATALARWRHSVATGEPFEIEYRRLRRDGEWRWLLGRALPARDEQGRITRWLGTSTDIEDQARTLRELRAAQEEVRQLNQGLERRVQERTAQLQEANRELESFSYSVSHDLRAPLRHVTGFAQLLQKRAGHQLDETSRGYLKTIFESAQQGGQLVDDLLAFSRMGRAALRRTRVQLRELVDEVVRELAPDARGRQVEWRVGPLPAVQGDPSMLRQVLRNLLANALKYTRPRERALIEVEARPQGAELHVLVRDNGVGFEMQYVDKLFGVFQRLHTAEQFEGTGIGLANVKRVITRHGGRVWAESAAGAGATFHFTLPLEDAPRD